MSISGRWVLDLADKDLLKFVLDKTRVFGQTLEINPKDILIGQNLSIASTRPEPGDSGEYDIVTWVKRRYHILKDNQVLSEITLDLPRITKIQVNASAALAINNNLLSPLEKQFLETTFHKYRPGIDKSITEYAVEKIVEYEKDNKPINADAYDLVCIFIMRWISTEIDVEPEIRMKKKFSDFQNGKRMPGQKESGSLESNGYSYKWISDDSESTTKSLIPDDYLVSVPEVASDQEKEDAVRKKAMDDAKNMECQNISLHVIKVKEVEIWTDRDWPMIWVYRKICGNAGLHTYWPIEHHRTVRHIIFATIFFPSFDDRRNIIKKVFDEALVDAAVVAWITADISEAIKAFKQTFFELLAKQVYVSIKCVVPSFYIAEIHEEWRQVG